MSSLQAVQIALEKGSAATAVGSTAGLDRTGGRCGLLSANRAEWRAWFRRELTRRGLQDRLGQSSSAHRAEDPYDGGESDVPVGFGCVED